MLIIIRVEIFFLFDIEFQNIYEVPIFIGTVLKYRYNFNDYIMSGMSIPMSYILYNIIYIISVHRTQLLIISSQTIYNSNSYIVPKCSVIFYDFT